MAEFIPDYKWTDLLKVQKMGRLKELKSGEVTLNDGYSFTFVNGNIEASGYLRTQTEYNCQTANAVGGLTLEEILEPEQDEVNPLACPECGRPCKSILGLRAHMRSHKELVHAVV